MAETAIKDLLFKEGVSARAINAGLRVLKGKRVMRGAALIDAQTGKRLDIERERGVRATLMGIDPKALSSLKRKLGRKGINTPTVLEALTLASKIASAPGIVAEFCASDDPGYTTGYVSSRTLGYTRITNIKKKGSMSGGRVFFISPGSDVDRLIRYLQETPVLIG
jgi:6-carboxyhexanoate--CoA ligase